MRKIFFWLHLSLGVTAGVFIFIMAATGVVLSFERQMTEYADRGIRSVSVPNDAQPRSLNQLLESVRAAGLGEPSAIVARNDTQAAAQFSMGRGRTVYVDPYSGAILGFSSPALRDFFSGVERLHRSLGTPLGSKSIGHWLVGVSNLLFVSLILLGLILWLPRKWRWRTIRASIAFRAGLSGKAREWNWHNVLGIWCAIPLLVIALTGVVMSFEWANALLFRLTGSVPAAGRRPPNAEHREQGMVVDPNYDNLFTITKTLNQDWRTITLNVAHDANAPISVVLDTGTGGQPQLRTQYLLNRDSGSVIKISTFADNSLGQKLRSFVRFGHTGEYYGVLGQAIAALASLASCLLVYTGLSLSVRRLAAKVKQKQRSLSKTVAI